MVAFGRTKSLCRFPSNELEEQIALNANPPKVSVILPTYNGSKYIAQSIKALLDQTFTDWELIVVDDCSTDGTGDIVLGFKDPRIHYTRNGVNCRLPRSLNRGFSLVSGEYLTWTSDDNWHAPNALERLVSALDANPDVDLVASHFYRVDEEGKIIGERVLQPAFLMQDVNPVGACFMYRRSILHKIGLYNTDFFKAEDAEYWMRINRLGLSIRTIDEYLYYYRVHGASLTATSCPDDIAELYGRMRRKYITRWHRLKVRIYRRAVRYSNGATFTKFFALLLSPRRMAKAVKWYENRFYVHQFTQNGEPKESVGIKVE